MYYIRRIETYEFINVFNDLFEARDYMMDYEFVELVRLEDGEVVSVKGAHDHELTKIFMSLLT